jgi:hypothetical protein
MLKNEALTQIQQIVTQASKKFAHYFLKKAQPKVTLLSDGISIDFLVKKQYSRSVNLGAFEELMAKYRESLAATFSKVNLTLEFWACSSTAMEWVIPDNAPTKKATNIRYSEFCIPVPDHDCDIVLQLPGNKELIVQLRPSNADVNYNGSLDIILPENTIISCFEGDDLQPAKTPKGNKVRSHEKFAKQLVCELPGDYYDDCWLDP